MILERTVAESLNEEKMTEMATQYANGFVRALEADKKLVVQPGQVLWTPRQARSFLAKQKSSFLKDHSRKRLAENGPFIHEQTIYTPLVEMGKEVNTNSKRIIDAVLGEKTRWRKCLEALRMARSDYVCLNGFGAEMGHLVGDQLYQDKDVGLHELMDVSSQLYESLKDTRYVCSVAGKECTSELDDKTSVELLARFSLDVKLYDAFIRDVDLEKFLKLMSEYRIKNKLKDIFFKLTEEYIRSGHYEGLTMFFKISEVLSADSNIFPFVHSIMSNPEVKTTFDALRLMGVSGKELEKYRRVFPENPADKIAYLLEKTDNFSSTRQMK